MTPEEAYVAAFKAGLLGEKPKSVTGRFKVRHVPRYVPLPIEAPVDKSVTAIRRFGKWVVRLYGYGPVYEVTLTDMGQSMEKAIETAVKLASTKGDKR